MPFLMQWVFRGGSLRRWRPRDLSDKKNIKHGDRQGGRTEMVGRKVEGGLQLAPAEIDAV